MSITHIVMFAFKDDIDAKAIQNVQLGRSLVRHTFNGTYI